MLGRESSLLIDLITGSPTHCNDAPVEYAEWLKEAMQTAFDFAHEYLQSSFKKQKRITTLN